MRFAPNALPKTMAREDKEARLSAFIRNHIETFRASGAAPGMTTYRLLAISVESPAARALGELAPELSAAGIHVEAVLARRTGTEKIEGAECRFVSDLRLLDAHEQLVLDRVTAWIGDCMRRAPLKRDDYALYSDSPVTASHAARSFSQIWRAAGPQGSLTAEPRWTGLRQASLFDPSLIAGAEAMATPHLLPIRH
ncbi:MAG: hypothetical protein J0H65_10625 [Rhizobiales bacterium]|nr:hypothetical protein [Hyphomicrobiales bacterium]